MESTHYQKNIYIKQFVKKNIDKNLLKEEMMPRKNTLFVIQGLPHGVG